MRLSICGWFYVFILVSSPFAAHSADVITRCGESDGYTYYVEGGAVQKNQSDWRADKISGSSLLVREGDKYDIIFTDSAKRTISSTEDGARIVPISLPPEPLVLLVIYPRTLAETWVFDIDSSGRGFVTFHQARYGAVLIKKHSVMRAECSK